MKRFNGLRDMLPRDISEAGEMLGEQWKRNPLPIIWFLVLCLNLVIAPSVDAATGVEITRKSAYAIGLLGLVTFGLFVYLFVVIFQPERF